MKLRSQQLLLARFVSDPTFAARVRSQPGLTVTEFAVEERFVAWLCALEPRRIAAFRRSQTHKSEVREGKAPQRIRG